MSRQTPRIRVKLINRGQPGTLWAGQFPRGETHWGDCEFILDRAATRYDWLVVVDDVSRGNAAAPEPLACADAHTLLVTSEPPTITRYGRAFAGQFAQVLTSQPPAALPHPHRIYAQTGNLWFSCHNFDQLTSPTPPAKSKLLSTVCSSKQQKHTLHNARYEFTRWLQGRIPEMDLFGHGIRYIERKFEALDPYRFHLAIENHRAPHHWTEKLADPYLCQAIPIYCGCTNIQDYFPEESYLLIDINEPEQALDTIQSTLADPQAYQKRRDALQEARHRVLYQYNLIAVVAEIVSQAFTPDLKPSGRLLYGRQQMRLRHPGDLLSHLLWSAGKSLS